MSGPPDWPLLWRMKELERQVHENDARNAAAIKALRRQLKAIRDTLDEWRTWGFRAILLIGWWGGGTYLNLTAEEKSQIASQLLLSFLGR